jgi:hypothetical protein
MNSTISRLGRIIMFGIALIGFVVDDAGAQRSRTDRPSTAVVPTPGRAARRERRTAIPICKEPGTTRRSPRLNGRRSLRGGRTSRKRNSPSTGNTASTDFARLEESSKS